MATLNCSKNEIFNLTNTLATLDCVETGNNFLRMPSSGMLRRVALVRTDVSEELSASFIRMTIIDC
jgi:hypothetical protein